MLRIAIAALLTVSLAPPVVVAAQGSAQAPSSTSSLPSDVDRIQRALRQEPALDLNDQQLRFYLEIVAKQPKWSEYVKGYDFINGPTRGGSPMTHDEFLKLVTPKEHYGTAGIKPMEMLQFALTNWLGQALMRRAFDELKDARTESEMQEIRDRIDRELAILRGDARNSP